jgi:hypothetical protein
MSKKLGKGDEPGCEVCCEVRQLGITGRNEDNITNSPQRQEDPGTSN